MADSIKNIREVLEKLEAQRENAARQRNIAEQMEQSSFNRPFGGEYSGSKIQEQIYENVFQRDEIYADHIREVYGTYDNYLKTKKIQRPMNVYDPSVDYIIDVNVYTRDAVYRTDHISADQVILEALNGVCTVVFMKVTTGTVGRITGTLEKRYIPNSQYRIRRQLFSPQRGDRIIMWDLNKSDWRSFYMNMVIKFVRDDTTGLE